MQMHEHTRVHLANALGRGGVAIANAVALSGLCDMEVGGLRSYESRPACNLKRGVYMLGLSADCAQACQWHLGASLGGGCGLQVFWLHSRIQLSSGKHDSSEM